MSLYAAGAQLDMKNNDDWTVQDIAIMRGYQTKYDSAVAEGLAERKRYEHAQQIANQKITEVMFPDEIEEPEISAIIGEYAYNLRIPEDLPKESWWDFKKRLASKLYWGNQ